MIYHIQTQQEILKVVHNLFTGNYLVYCHKLSDVVLKVNIKRWLFVRQMIEGWHTQKAGCFLLVYTPPQGAGEVVTVPLPPFNRPASVKRYRDTIRIWREKLPGRNRDMKRFSGHYHWNDITDSSRARLLRLLDSDPFEKYAYTDLGWRETKVEEFCFDCDPDVEIEDEWDYASWIEATEELHDWRNAPCHYA